VPPHVASGETFLVGVDAGGGACVDEVLTVTGVAFDVVLPVHVPNAELQLAPQ